MFDSGGVDEAVEEADHGVWSNCCTPADEACFRVDFADWLGALAPRQAVHEDELLAGHERGRQVLRLRTERENLLDVIWLATSPTQVRQLWTKVAELLGEEPSQLEREALLIPTDKEV